jgi:hypothetical protein
MKSNKSKIRIGEAGVEARLFLVQGYRNDTERTDETGKPTPKDTLRVAADDIDDVITHVKKYERGFDIYVIRLVGMVVVASGSAYQG